MYAADNNGKLIQNVALAGPFAQEQQEGTNSWVYGNMKTIADSTNLSLLRKGSLFPYLPQPAAFHCPADQIDANGWPRLGQLFHERLGWKFLWKRWNSRQAAGLF